MSDIIIPIEAWSDYLPAEAAARIAHARHAVATARAAPHRQALTELAQLARQRAAEWAELRDNHEPRRWHEPDHPGGCA